MPPSIQKIQKTNCFVCNEEKDCKLFYMDEEFGKQFCCKECFLKPGDYEESTWNKIKTDGSI